MIVPLHKEVLVVEKRLAVAEELHITKKQTKTQRPETVTLRSQEAVVERIDPRDPQADTQP